MSQWRRYRNAFMHHFSRHKLYAVTVILAILVLVLYRRSVSYSYTGSKYDVYTTFFGDYPLPDATQGTIDYFANYVRLNYSVEDNLVCGKKLGDGGYFMSSITLHNTGNKIVPASRWQMFGYFMRLAEADSYPYPGGFFIQSCGLRLYSVVGSLYKFEPVGRMFKGLHPRQTLVCRIKQTAFQVARTDSMPRWYVTGENLAPRVIANTDDETLSFVKDFTEARQYKMREDDPSHPYSALERYNVYAAGRKETVTTFKVIPTPLELTVNEKTQMDFNTRTWVFVKSDVFPEEVKNFAEGMNIKIVNSIPIRRYIQVVKFPVVITWDGKPVQHPEAYTIEADPKKWTITIKSSTAQGVFYAFQTLSSMAFAPEAQTNVGINLRMPEFTVKDGPRYSYRGLHMDVARNFIEVEQVLKIIDVLAMYKMNKLHLHLSDDEGWRLEIPGVPELTQIGGSRCHDPDEDQCILPMLGSGPYSNTSGSGFYTIGDYREILAYAKERHIEVIPEFDMPGHSRAAVKSIHANREQARRKQVQREIYSVIDDNDNFQYRSGQHFSHNVLNPCIPSTYVFVRKVLKEVKRMHADIQPLAMYHFGGDEVGDKAWLGSPKCDELMQRRKDVNSHYDLMKLFVNNVTKMATEEGMSVGAWEDAMLSHDVDDVGIPFPRDSFQNKEIFVYVWKRPKEKNTPHRAKLFANKDYKVILAYGAYLYFDHPHEPDPEERGLYWATRKISTKTAWLFSPDVMFNDRELPCPPSVKNEDMCFKLLKPDNIMGMQAELWTETVRTNEQIEYMLFPRLLAVAERAWHKAPWEGVNEKKANKMKDADWSKFINAVGYHELPRLDKAGVKYRIGPPGAIKNGNRVRFMTEFPGLDIEYYNTQTKRWTIVSHDMPVRGTIQIRTRSTDGKRYSRTIEI